MTAARLEAGALLTSEHVDTETAGGVTMAGAAALAKVGRLGNTDEVVLYITGNGLKTAEAVTDVLVRTPVISPSMDEVEKIIEPRS